MVLGKVEQVKGEALLSEFGWVKHKKGETGLTLVFEDLNEGRPPHMRLSLKDYKDDGWYPVETQMAVLKSIEKRFGDGKPDILREVGAYGVRNITKFSFFIRFMDPHAVGDKLAGSISLLYRTLNVTVKHTGDRSMDISIVGFPDDPVYCALMRGGIEQILVFLKLDEPVVKTKVGGGCSFILAWK